MKHPYQYFHETGDLPLASQDRYHDAMTFVVLAHFVLFVVKPSRYKFISRWWNGVGKQKGLQDWINKEKIVNSDLYHVL